MFISTVTLTSDSHVALNELQVKEYLCFIVFKQQFNIYERQKPVSKIKCYLETASDHPTYFATLMLVHGIAICVFVYFSKKCTIMIIMQK